MARNRMIKPEFWSSETLNRVSLEARLTFIGIWNFCDDYGFCLNNTRSLLGDIFPLDESVSDKKLSEWINELIREKLLIPLEYKGKKLIFVKGWAEHQTVANKSKRSYIQVDDLQEVIESILDTNETLISIYLESNAPKRKKKEKEESNKGKASSEDEIISFCNELSLPLSDASYLWNHWQSNDWTNSGKKIKDWKATIRKWKAAKYLPSQKNNTTNNQTKYEETRCI